MKLSFGKIGITCLALLVVGAAAIALAQTQETSVAEKKELQYPNLADKKKELVISRGMTKEAANCIECHAKKMPGTVAAWKLSQMGHAGIS
ncbi:MAG: hypothetical protein ABIL06_24395, partial [Pseudomonadota bacterium]